MNFVENFDLSFLGVVHQRLLGIGPSGRHQLAGRASPAQPDLTHERITSRGDREETRKVQNRLSQ